MANTGTLRDAFVDELRDACDAERFTKATMNACLIASAQRVEHYEMAACGALVAWAHATNSAEAAKLLQETFEEEKAADGKLSALAEAAINQAAAGHVVRRRRR